MLRERNSWRSKPVSSLDAEVQKGIRNKGRLATAAVLLTPILASVAVIAGKAMLGSKYITVGQNEEWKPLEDPDILGLTCFLSGAASATTGLFAPLHLRGYKRAKSDYRKAIEGARTENGIDVKLLEAKLDPIDDGLARGFYV